MNVEIIEEVETAENQNNFLPPVICAVRKSGRSILGLIWAVLFFVLSLFAGIFLPRACVFVIPSAILLLFSNIISFKKSGRLYGGYGLNFQSAAYIISAVFMFSYAVLEHLTKNGTLTLPKLLFWDYIRETVSSVLVNLADYVQGYHGNFSIIAAVVGLCLLCAGLTFGSLKHSKAKNLAFTKTLFWSAVANFGSFAFVCANGLKELNILIPCKCPLDLKTALPNAILLFAIATVLLLLAVRLLIIYIRMRKVKNAVLKA